MNGVRGEGDNPNALEAFREAAEKGDAHSQAQLGRMYLYGLGVDRDFGLALAWYQKSAVQGNGAAQANLGHMVEKGLGIDPDIQHALAWYKKSAAQGNALGQVWLGDLYLHGSGVDQSSRKALACYQKSAEQGEDPESAVLAQLRLAAMYCQGLGVEKDLRRGFELYHQVAKLGNAEAQRCVGAMYRDGMGVERNHKKALEWFRKSAGENRTPADSAMGDIYRDGLFVEKNIPEAMTWYAKAAARGDKYAKSELLKLQQMENARERPGAGPAPAGLGESLAAAGAANMDRPREGAGTKGEKPGERNEQAVADRALSPSSQPRPAPRPSAADLASGGKARKQLRQKAALRQNRRIKRSPAPRTPLHVYLLPAIGIIGVSLLIVLFSFRRNSGKVPESLPSPASGIAVRIQPLPPVLPEPPPETLQEIKASKAPRRPSSKISLAVEEPQPAVAPSEPVLPRLRREAKSLDEVEITEMLAAKNMFDAQRNPGGHFSHQYKPTSVAGLRLIVDRASQLVWTRQQNPVKMNLDKSRQWIESLNRVGYGGIRSWRLPTVEEAASLLQRSADDKKMFLDGVFGEGITEVWTGDLHAGSDSWTVDFLGGVIRKAKGKSRLMTIMVSSDPGPSGETTPDRRAPAAADPAATDGKNDENGGRARGGGSGPPLPIEIPGEKW